MFSQTAEYALRVIVYLARERTRPATTKEIAAATHVPEGYLAKVLQGLGHIGLVHSQRGLHGGFVLGKKANELTLFDVIESVDPVPRVRSCPLGLKSHGECLCPLHKRLDRAFGEVEKVFRESTIAELLAEITTSPMLEETNGHAEAAPAAGPTA